MKDKLTLEKLKEYLKDDRVGIDERLLLIAEYIDDKEIIEEMDFIVNRFWQQWHICNFYEKLNHNFKEFDEWVNKEENVSNNNQQQNS